MKNYYRILKILFLVPFLWLITIANWSYESLSGQTHLGWYYYVSSLNDQLICADRGSYLDCPESSSWSSISSLEILGWKYIKDRWLIYYWLFSTIENVDAESFRFLWEINASWVVLSSWAKDKNNIYYNGKSISYTWFDVSSFEIIWEGFEYVKDKNALYRKILSNNYSDLNDALNFERIDWIDPETVWEVLDKNAQSTNKTYLKDKNGVYYKWKRVSGADPETFYAKELDYQIIWFDKNNVYVHDETLDKADPETFQTAFQYGGSQYFKDKNQWYFIHESSEYGREFKKILYIHWIDFSSFGKTSIIYFFCWDGWESCDSEIEWKLKTGCSNRWSLIQDDYSKWCQLGDSIVPLEYTSYYTILILVIWWSIVWIIRIRRKKMLALNTSSLKSEFPENN